MTSLPIRLSTNFMTFIPSLTFTELWVVSMEHLQRVWLASRERFPSGHLVPSPFWDLLMLQLLRPNSSNLLCLYSTFHLEYPLVLSRFCFMCPRGRWFHIIRVSSKQYWIRRMGFNKFAAHLKFINFIHWLWKAYLYRTETHNRWKLTKQFIQATFCTRTTL